MTIVNYVIRDSAGGITRGIVPSDLEAAMISLAPQQDLSLNLSESDVSGFRRDGDALVIELADGRVIMVDNYFVGNAPSGRLFFSSDGFLTEVAFTSDGAGGVFAEYGAVQQLGKWSPSDDLIFFGRSELTPIGGEEEVSMLAAAGLFGGAGGGLAAAAAAAGIAAVALADDDSDAPVVNAGPAAPFVNDADASFTIGGDANAPHSITITGGGEPGDTVVAKIGTQEVTSTIAANGTWSATFEGATLPADGSYEASVVVNGTAGGAVLDGPSYVIDTTPPQIEVLSGTVAAGDAFNADEFQNGITLSGTGEPGASVDITISGVVRSTTVADDGSWSATWELGSLSSGEYTEAVTIVTTDAIGNAATTTDALRIDTVSSLGIDTGAVGGDGVINDDERLDGVDVTGTADPGATVDVILGDTTKTVTADENGDWTVTFGPDDIPVGSYDTDVRAVATDDVGNQTTATGPVRVDTEITPFTITSQAGGDDAVLNAAERGSGLTVTGTVEPGASVDVQIGDVVRAATVADDGSWTVDFTSADIPEGTYDTNIVATARDVAGNSDTLTQSFLVDTGVFNLTINTPVEADDIVNGAEAADGVVISGTVEPGSAVEVTLGDVTTSAVVGASGAWTATFAATDVPTGEYDTQISVQAQDAAGNTDQLTHNVRVDTLVNALAFDENSTSTTLEGDGTINALETFDGVALGGTVEPGSTVVLTFDGTEYTAAVDPAGFWSVTIPEEGIRDGVYDASVSVTAVDGAGNTETISQTISVDTEAPDGPVMAAFTRDTGGLRAVSTEGDNSAISIDQVTESGAIIDAPSTDEYSAGLDETQHIFQTRVPDGSDLIVSRTDAAGNVTSTYLALDDENPGSEVDLSNPGLVGTQVSAVDLQFAEAATLSLTEAAILSLSDTTNTLRVTGGVDDTVRVSGAQLTGSSDGANVYQLGAATLIVDRDITVEDTPVI